MANPKKQKLVNKQGTTIYPLTEASQIIVDEDGTRLNAVLDNIDTKWAGCWISFTDENGNPTDEPYIHWYTEPEEITFSTANLTDTYSYIAKEGMTWGEWIDSEYNTAGWITYEDGFICSSAYTSELYYDETPIRNVSSTDVIINNYTYLIQQGGGND